MKKRLTKVVCVVLAAILSVSLAGGCKKADSGAGQAGQKSSAGQEAADSAQAGGQAGEKTGKQDDTQSGDESGLKDLPEVKWKISHTQSPDNFMNTALEDMAKQVSDKTGGKFKIEIYHSGTLGSEQEVIEGMQMGTIAGNMASVSLLANFVPSFDVFNLPGVFASKDALKSALGDEEIMKPIMDQARDNNIIVEGSYQEYFRMLFSKTPIKEVTDFKGQKIRVMGSPVLVDTFQALGCNSTTTAWSELYSGLQLGVVDGLDHVPTSVRTMNFFDHVKYMAEPDIFASPMFLIISKPLYEKLPDEYKQILDEAMTSCMEDLNAVANQINEEDIEYLKSQGMEMVDIDVDGVHEAIAPVRDKYLGQMEPWVQDIAKKIMELK